jgi:hypothetical protein
VTPTPPPAAQPTSPPAADPGKTLAWRFGHVTGDLGRYFAGIAPALKTTPGQLRGMMLAVGLLAAITLIVIRWAVADHRTADRAVTTEATKSIVAAQKAKAALAAMHASAVRRLLGGGPDAAKEYERQRVEVTDALLVAAKYTTYKGEEEQLRILLNQLSRYEGAIAAAVARAEDRAEVIRKVREADGILEGQLSPATDELDRINFTELDKEYDWHKRFGQLWELGVLVAGAVLVVALFCIQIYLRRQFRRLCNPLVLLATALTVGFMLFAFARLHYSWNELRRAKEDAFDSIHNLRKAKAEGYRALAAGQLRLLDPERAEDYKGRLHKATMAVATLPPDVGFDKLVADARKLNLKQSADKARLSKDFKGHLKEELGNITFDGEQDAALAALASFGEFVEATATLRGDGAAPLAGALHSATVTAKFARFDADLDKVIVINEQAFDREIGRGEAALSQCGTLNLWAMLGVVVLTSLGLYPRMREYAI